MDDIYLIALACVQDVGPVTARKLLKEFGSAEAVFAAPEAELVAKAGQRARHIKKFNAWDWLEKAIKRLKRQGVSILTYDSDHYPVALVDGPDMPVVLYMKGEMAESDRYSVAVVGSRKASEYGLTVAGRLAGELASAGLTVVSGLARGIDTASHMGALGGGGRSIAVLGSGIDVPYPYENKGLIERLAESGFVLSEFPPGTGPLKENFPRRNRLISALSMGVVVVEAARGSGALITARYALDQNKEVFAIPGNINSPTSMGANDLIKSGARVVMSAEDVLSELAPMLRGFIKERKRVKIEVSDEERVFCDVLSGEPKHVDDISREISQPASKTLSMLLTLELKGVVRQMGGKRFSLD